MSTGAFVARLLDASASAFGAYAAGRLLELHPEIHRRFGVRAFENWKAKLTHAVEDLAVAVELESPELFSHTVRWARQLFASRDLPQDDLRASFECLRDVLARELPEGVWPRVEIWFSDALLQFHEPLRASSPLDAGIPSERLALQYIQECLAGDVSGATKRILDAVEKGIDVQSAYLDVLAAAQAEVGRLWHIGELAIHEEHCVTSTTLELIPLLAARAPHRQPNGKTVVGASAPGNAHEIGIRMVMSLFAIEGWRSIPLGELPAHELAAAVVSYDADLVVLSGTLVRQLRTIHTSVGAIRERSPRSKILVGGLAFSAAPGIWKRVGADALADRAELAVQVGTELVSV